MNCKKYQCQSSGNYQQMPTIYRIVIVLGFIFSVSAQNVSMWMIPTSLGKCPMVFTFIVACTVEESSAARSLSELRIYRFLTACPEVWDYVVEAHETTNNNAVLLNRNIGGASASGGLGEREIRFIMARATCQDAGSYVCEAVYELDGNVSDTESVSLDLSIHVSDTAKDAVPISEDQSIPTVLPLARPPAPQLCTPLCKIGIVVFTITCGTVVLVVMIVYKRNSLRKQSQSKLRNMSRQSKLRSMSRQSKLRSMSRQSKLRSMSRRSKMRSMSRQSQLRSMSSQLSRNQKR